MQQRQISLFVNVYENLDKLNPEQKELAEQAIEAMQLSYSPYSNFKVGAALRLDDGSIVRGANVENASYPLCLCAERVALASVRAAHPGRRVVAMAITASNAHGGPKAPVTPCGACRQVLVEHEQAQGSPIELCLLAGGCESVVQVESAAALLPLSFDASYLLGA